MSNRLKLESNSCLTCGICGKLYDEPRILPCLHTFCTKCIKGLDTYVPMLLVAAKSKKKPQNNLSLGSNKDSVTSGYDSETSLDNSKVPPPNAKPRSVEHSDCRNRIPKGRTVLCPTCDVKNDIPRDGASSLPLHYVLQNKLLQLSINGICGPLECNRSVCDLCIGDVHAVSWCTECSTSLCAFCFEAHKRQRKTKSHKVCALSEAIQLGFLDLASKTAAVAQSRCLPVCPSHPTEELLLFCDPCKCTICKDCLTVGDHRSHSHRSVFEVAPGKIQDLRNLLERALPKTESLRKSLADLRASCKQIQAKEEEVIGEVNSYADDYVKAVEEHRRSLLDKVKRTCEVKQRILQLQSIQAEQALEELETLCNFVKQLLEDGSDVEVVTLLCHVGKRLQDLGSERHRLEPRVDPFLQFIPKESSAPVNGFPVSGIVTAQRVCPQKCTVKGIPVMRQGRKVDILLQTRDMEGQPMHRGGCNPKVELASKVDLTRSQPVKVIDRKDGTYQFTIKSEDTGLFWLSIKVQDQHIQGSPYPLPVKAKGLSHSGIYHCCTFCSSAGTKEATCACGGTMPGGFKGCGHNHKGHPGKRHWSCCGKTTENSDCSRTVPKILQFTL